MSYNLDPVHLYKDIDEEIIYDVLKIIINYFNDIKYTCDSCNKNTIRGLFICHKCYLYLCEDCHISRVNY